MIQKPPAEHKTVKRARSEAEACEALRLAVIAAAARSTGSIKELRVALEQFTVIFREAGTPPEAVLVHLKRVIDQRSTPGLPLKANVELSPIIREQMSTWCIQDYFRKTTV